MSCVAYLHVRGSCRRVAPARRSKTRNNSLRPCDLGQRKRGLAWIHPRVPSRRIERPTVAGTGLALTCANRPVKRHALACASVSRVPLCHERSAGECVDQSSGYAQVRGRREGRLFTGPRFVISRSRVQVPPPAPASSQQRQLPTNYWARTTSRAVLDQQRVALGDTRGGGRAHPLCRHTERGAVPRAKIRCAVLEVQGLRALLALSHPWRRRRATRAVAVDPSPPRCGLLT